MLIRYSTQHFSSIFLYNREKNIIQKKKVLPFCNENLGLFGMTEMG